MSNYKIVRPIGRTNYIKNPQARYNVTDGWTFTQDGSGGGLTHNCEQQHMGPCSFALEAGTDRVQITTSYQVSVPEDSSAFLSAWFYAPQTSTYGLEISDGSSVLVSTSDTVQNEWHKLTLRWRNTQQSSVNIEAVVYNASADTVIVYADAVFLEIAEGATIGAVEDSETTYLDGDQDGCWWRAEPHNSYSERSAASRAGGVVLDFKDDFDFGVKALIDAGAPRTSHFMHEYAVRPGGEIRGTKVHPSAFTMHGMLRDRSGGGDDIHTLRNRLVDEILPWAYPRARGQYQPVTLRYTGSSPERYIRAHYEDPTMRGMLDSQVIVTDIEELDLNWLAAYPFWRALSESAQSVEPRGTVQTYGVLTYDGRDGTWDNAGTSAHTSFNLIDRVIYNQHDGCVYVFGEFDGWLGNSGWNNVVRYNLSTDSWEQVGGSDAVNDRVHDAALAPNGDIYIGGDFLNCGGADGDYLAYWDLSASAWTPVAAGGSGSVYAVEIDHEGNVWYGGNFTSWNSDGNIDYIGYWNGSSYQSAGSGASTVVYDIRSVGTLVYASGQFTSPGTYFASWDGSSWTDRNPDSVIGESWRLVEGADGSLYLWDYGNAKVMRYTGASFVEIGQVNYSGTANIYAMAISPDGELWVSGAFDDIDGETNTAYLARWNGASWLPFPVSGGVVKDVEFFNQDPLISSAYQVWLGLDFSDVQYEVPVTVTATNEGNAPAGVRLIFEQSSVNGTLRVINNLTTGAKIYPNYTIQTNEVVKIEITNTAVLVTSDLRGSIPHALSVGGDESQFLLQPGDNIIELLVESGSASSSTAYIVWCDTYSGVD